MIGDENEANRRAIEHYGNVPVVGWIPVLPLINRPALTEVYNRYFDREVFARGV